MKTIKMGNDEFILYIRKWNKNCSLSNEAIGRKIWDWIKANDASAKQIVADAPTSWHDQEVNINGKTLPKTATQFEFNKDILDSLYDFLDTL